MLCFWLLVRSCWCFVVVSVALFMIDEFLTGWWSLWLVMASVRGCECF